MMKKLGIREEDLDDVVFEKEEQSLAEATRWLAIVRVHMEKDFSEYWFFKNMRTTQDLAKDVKFISLGSKLFAAQLMCLGDWDKVMEGGPLTFRGNPVLLALYDGFSETSLFELNVFKIWIQIHHLPDDDDSMVTSLTTKVGEFVTTKRLLLTQCCQMLESP